MGTRPGGTGYKQYIIQNNNWGTPSGSDQTITYNGATFTIMSTTGNVTGQGVPASFPSIYVGNNGDTQTRTIPPWGPTPTKPNDGLPKADQRDGLGEHDRRLQQAGRRLQRDVRHLAGRAGRRPPLTATRSPASSWSGSTSPPVGPRSACPKATKTIDGTSYNDLGGAPRQRQSNSNRPVISYVTNSMNKTFNLKPILDDAAANSATYTSGTGASNITSSMYVTDIFFGFEVWTGSAAANLSVTNFSVDVK